MRWLAAGIVLCLVAFTARAEDSETAIRAFEKGKTTYKQVVAELGEPAKTETNDEGLMAIAYPAQGGQPSPAPASSIFAALANVFAATGGTSAGPDQGENSISAFVFDRNGVLLLYRVASGAGTKAITSEDGAGPMPNVNLVLDDEQRKALVPAADGKPHLGVQLVPVSDLDEQHRADFAAAKFDGMVVANVLDGSVAHEAGLRVGDYLYVLNGMRVTSPQEILSAMATVKIGDAVKVRAKRIDQGTHLVHDMVFDLKF